MNALSDINKKSLESQKKIYKALRKLLLRMPLSNINVTDLCEECEISRSTFYRNFKNVVDILYVFFDYYYERYLLRRVANNTLLFFFQYWNFHKDLVHIIGDQAPSIIPDVMSKYMEKEYSDFDFNLKMELFVTIISKWSISKLESPEKIEKYVSEILSKKSIELLLD